ncbi:MAG: dehydrogenase subunit [Verrucomicrobiales bacterium]|nr:dehydrogenase subunit [Verrucomicrobiales bacterium]
MDLAFIIIAVLTLASAVAAMSLRNLVHCALCMVMTFAGIALTFLQLNAEFVGLAQLLVYVGAVAILIVFAILLTRSEDAKKEVRFVSSSTVVGFGVVALVAVSLLAAIQHTQILPPQSVVAPHVSVKRIGEQLMTNYVLPLEVIGLLLTAAMIGAVVIAMREPDPADSVDVQQRNGSPLKLDPDSKKTAVVANE